MNRKIIKNSLVQADFDFFDWTVPKYNYKAIKNKYMIVFEYFPNDIGHLTLTCSRPNKHR